MKKRTAGILVTTIALLLAGYVAWCSRSFYIGPRGLESPGIPQEVLAAVPPLAEAVGMMKPEKFRLKSFIRYLCRPYESRSCGKLVAIRSEQDVILVYRTGFHVPAFSFSRSLYFIRKSGRWMHVTEDDYNNHRNRWHTDPWKRSTPPRQPTELMDKALSDTLHLPPAMAS